MTVAARLRIALSAAHDEADIDRQIDAPAHAAALLAHKAVA